MIRLEDGTKLADTDEQIKRMFLMAKRLYLAGGKAAVLDMEDERDRAFVKTILEERPVTASVKDGRAFEGDVICLTGIHRCETESMLSVGAKARTEAFKDLLALHILVFTCNDDGLLKPVSLSGTVTSAGDAGQVDNICKIRKANIQSRSIGAMMTFLKINGSHVAAMAKIELLEGKLKERYLALRDW